MTEHMATEGRTDDERNHGGSIASSGLKALDQLLHLPYLNVLFRFVRLCRAHGGRGDGIRRPREKRLNGGLPVLWTDY